MSRSMAVITTTFFLVIQLLSTATNARQISVRCWKSDDPVWPYTEIKADTEGQLYWNGVPTDWKTIQIYLAELSRSVVGKGGNAFVEIQPKTPHAREIEGILAKKGMRAQAPNCRVPMPVKPVY